MAKKKGKKSKPKPKGKGKGKSSKPISLDATTQSVLALTGEANRGYKTRRNSADAAARGLTDSLNARESAVPQRYNDVASETSKADASIAGVVGGLGKGADALRAAIANTQGAGLQRSARAKAAELADIGDSKTSVQRVRSSQHAQAGQDFQETLRTISGEVSKAAAESGKLKQADIIARRQYRLTKRGQDVTARGQDISAATQAAGQAVTARGQDKTAATAAANRADKDKSKGKSAGSKLGAAVRSSHRKHSLWGHPNRRKRVVDDLVLAYDVDRSVAMKTVNNFMRSEAKRRGVKWNPRAGLKQLR